MLDYTSRKKKMFPVKLIDERTVLLCAPKKALFTKLSEFEEDMKELDEPLFAYDRMLDLAAEILSTNMSGVKFTNDEIDVLFDLEDMAALIFEYSKFAGQLTNNPN